MLDTYQLVAHKNETQHTIYLDTPTFTLWHADVSLHITVINQSKQTLSYTVAGAPPQTHALTSNQWPADVLAALGHHGVTAHTLVPMVQFISKRHMRHLCDSNAHEIAQLVLCYGTMYVHGQLEPFCEIELSALSDTATTLLPAIATRIQQDIPSMQQTTPKLVRGWQLAQQQRATPDHASLLHQHLSMLQGTQRSGDDALFIPLPHTDTAQHRIICACAIQLLHNVVPDMEPLWLALDDATQQQVRQLVAHSEVPAYAIYGAAIPLNQQLFSEALRLQLRSQFRRMLIRRHDVLQSFDAEYVHRMRVILRKIRALLECADSIYDDEALNQYKRGFRRMARFLGEVRDCDVLSENIQRIAGDTPLAPEIMRAIAQTRTHALQALHELFTGSKHQQFIGEFATFVATPHASTQPAAHTVLSSDMLSSRIAERTVEFQKPWTQSLERSEDTALHAWRIRGKRLRYMLECFPSVIIPATAPALQLLDETQHHLGILQDAVVAFELFNKMKLHTHPDCKKIITQLRQEAHQQRQQLPRLWHACTSSSFNDAIFATIHAIQ